MRGHRRRFAIRFLISATVAAGTPAIAAGLVAGVSAATDTVADAASPQPPDDLSAGTSNPGTRVATHGPARPSLLVGNGDISWHDASRMEHSKKIN
jgi:hypothetical protein